MVKRALITGATGQDAYYLAKWLKALYYEVHATTRRVSSRQEPIACDSPALLHYATLESHSSLIKVVRDVMPDECYHLASQSDVKNSFQDPFSTMEMNIHGTHYLLDALYTYKRDCRFYFAGSSEMFGGVGQQTQNESTPFNPRSPYAISKVSGFHLTKHYREACGMYCVSGILFNHESPRRGTAFVTRKIAMAAANIKKGRQDVLLLGDLSPERDWGYAPEYVQAMREMLQQSEPDDYVIATNETHSVQEFVEAAFDHVGLDWNKYVVASKDMLRPCEVMRLKGDYSKANRRFGWEPEIKFEGLVKLMVDAEMEKA